MDYGLSVAPLIFNDFHIKDVPGQSALNEKHLPVLSGYPLPTEGKPLYLHAQYLSPHHIMSIASP